VSITIELPDLESQTAFNLARWAEILDDPRLAKLPERIETDRHGNVLMTPPPAFRHSLRQGHIIGFLHWLMPEGQTLPECPLSTADGVKAINVAVAWLEHGRPEIRQDLLLLTRAPEICIEMLSPSNTPSEMDEKRALYFDAALPKSGSAISMAPCLFSLVRLITNLPLLPCARHSRAGFPEFCDGIKLSTCNATLLHRAKCRQIYEEHR
jgi:hypothetical protein